MPRTVQTAVDSSAIGAVAALVGNTPMLEIHYRFDGCPRRVYAKYDTMNMTGSVGNSPPISMAWAR